MFLTSVISYTNNISHAGHPISREPEISSLSLWFLRVSLGSSTWMGGNYSAMFRLGSFSSQWHRCSSRPKLICYTAALCLCMTSRLSVCICRMFPLNKGVSLFVHMIYPGMPILTEVPLIADPYLLTIKKLIFGYRSAWWYPLPAHQWQRLFCVSVGGREWVESSSSHRCHPGCRRHLSPSHGLVGLSENETQ